MKLFLGNLVKFLAFAFVVMHLLAWAVLEFPTELSYVKKWYYVKEILVASKRKIKHKRIIIGDSVSQQLYPYNKEKNHNYLSTNGSVLAAGQYILLYNALQKNEHIQEVIYVTLPHVLIQRFEEKRVYSSFVKPFLTPINFRHFSPTVKKKISKHPVAWLEFSPLYKVLPTSDIDYSMEKDKDELVFSDISVEYIKKIDALCKKHKVKLIFVSPPVHQSYFEIDSNWNSLREDATRMGIKRILGNYFEQPVYWGIDDFRPNDNLHFAKHRIDSARSITEQRINRELDIK